MSAGAAMTSSAAGRSSDSARSSALLMIAWSRIWSPLVLDALRDEAWAALKLPGTFASMQSEYWSLFHVGSPSAPIPTLLHAALGRDGGSVREDWMRATHHLGLRWSDARLAPDQLGVACEVYAYAIECEEPVLIEELRRRYLLPWSEFAAGQLEGSDGPLASLPSRFSDDLESVAVPGPSSVGEK
jgi:hypothetical protein